MLQRLKEIFSETCNKCAFPLVEFNGECDHVHLLVNFSPQVQLSKLIANLKTVSSRLLRKEFQAKLERIYSKPEFLRVSYFVASCSGVTIQTLRNYVEGQACRSCLKLLSGIPHPLNAKSIIMGGEYRLNVGKS